jgi:hypothetical protein
MARKTVDFTKAGASQLPNDRPVVYEIKRKSGNTNYVGVAKAHRVQERILEHLQNGEDRVPGAKVMIQPMPTIADARRKEKEIIAVKQPKYNEKGT